MSTSRSIEYRPGTAGSLIVSGVWLVTAAIVGWLGFILGPEDREAMEGFTLLLFTMVPIRLFCWTMAPVLAGLGLLLAYRGLWGAPSLVISADGLTLRSGRSVPWSAVDSWDVTSEGHLVIEAPLQEASTEHPGWPSRLARVARRAPRGRIMLSSFDLGTAAENVAEEIEQRVAAVR